MSEKQFLHETEDNGDLGERQCASINYIKSNIYNLLTPEEINKNWNILLKTAVQTFQDTTNQCIFTTGLLAKRFKTEKLQLCYA